MIVSTEEAVWQWSNSPGWESFDLTTQVLLEQAHLSNYSQVFLTHSLFRQGYTVYIQQEGAMRIERHSFMCPVRRLVKEIKEDSDVSPVSESTSSSSSTFNDFEAMVCARSLNSKKDHVVWEWKDNAVWLKYDAETARVLESHFNQMCKLPSCRLGRNEPESSTSTTNVNPIPSQSSSLENSDPHIFLLSLKNNSYLINLHNMTQMNTTTNFSRPIQRRSVVPIGDRTNEDGILYRWKWQQDDHWEPFDPVTSDVIESAFLNGKETVFLDKGFYAKDTYTVDLKGMKQRNNRTDFVRVVKREARGDNNDIGVEFDKYMEEMPECPICYKRVHISELMAHCNRCLVKQDRESGIYDDGSGSGSGSGSDSGDEYYAPRGRNNTELSFDRTAYDPVNKKPFECPVCMDGVAVGGGYVYEKCQHKYCGECLNGYYQEAIMNGKADTIKCPHPDCDYMCTRADVRFMVPGEYFEKYEEFIKAALVKKNPDMRFCANPMGCDNAFRRQNENDLLMKCKKCLYEFCFLCGEEYHPKRTCEEWERWKLLHNKIDLRVYLWEKFNTKACPNCCAKIQKRGGCNHMTCQSCGHEFCWLCMAKYESAHFDTSRCQQFGGRPFVVKWGSRLKNLVTGDNSYSDDDTDSSSDEMGISEFVADVSGELLDRAEDIRDAAAVTAGEIKEAASMRFGQIKSFFQR